jgi:Tol biopolymer transport system component
MKPCISFCSLLCALVISQVTFAQTATFYSYLWSQDGSRFVVMTLNTTFSATVYNDQWQPLASREIPCCGATLSPDGKSLVVNSAPAEIWDTDTLQTIRVLPNLMGAAGWSPDGTELVAFDANPGGGIKLYSAADGRLLRDFTGPNSAFADWSYGPRWSPNGAYFAAGSGSRLVLLDPITGQQIGSNYQLDGDIEGFNWSSDSTKLVISLTKLVPEGTMGSFPRGDGWNSHDLRSIVVFEISTGNIMTLRRGSRYPASRLLWSPDDRYIVTNLDGNFYTIDSTNGSLVERFSITPNFTLIGWSPDGGRLLTGLSTNAPYDPTLWGTTIPPVAPRSTFAKTELGGLIQVLVPAASPERMQAILSECSSDTRLQASADTLLDAGQYPQFITQLDETTTLPASCAADLRVMAEALATEESTP